jgi:hypothetical protein
MLMGVLLLVVLLQIKHLFSDFFWQTQWMVHNKGIYGHPGGLAHVGVHALGTGLILLAFAPQIGFGLLGAICLAEAVLHYHIDWTKDWAVRRTRSSPMDKRFWDITGTDQALHQATYLGIAAVVFW